MKNKMNVQHFFLLIVGRDEFISAKCPVDTCQVTTDKNLANISDLIIFNNRFVDPGIVKQKRQIYMLYEYEPPYHTTKQKRNDDFNWTATYR